MAELPILPLKTDALIADTTHMSAEEFGAYCRILIAMWRHEARLPDNPHQLARIAGVSERRWPAIAECVMRPLTIAGGFITQKRLTSTWLDVHEHRLKQAKAGRSSARKAKRGKNGTFLVRAVGNNELGDNASQVFDFPQTASGQPSNQKPTNQNQISKKERREEESLSIGPVDNVDKPESGAQPLGAASGRATALPTGAPARPPPHEQVAKASKRPSEWTKAEIEKLFAAKRAKNGKAAP